MLYKNQTLLDCFSGAEHTNRGHSSLGLHRLSGGSSCLKCEELMIRNSERKGSIRFALIAPVLAASLLAACGGGGGAGAAIPSVPGAQNAGHLALQPSVTPTPAATPATKATSTPNPRSTSTPVSVATAAASATPKASSTPAGSPTPKASSTPAASPTPKASSTPVPTPVPTATPKTAPPLPPEGVYNSCEIDSALTTMCEQEDAAMVNDGITWEINYIGALMAHKTGPMSLQAWFTYDASIGMGQIISLKQAIYDPVNVLKI